MTNHIYSKKKHPIKFDLIVFRNYVYMLFLCVDFCSSNIKKEDLTARSERRR